jgi:Ca-activated chloride channel family protein
MVCDVRIVLTWDADNTDMDLWVTGPDGERCSYDNPETMTGGHMSEDFTQGYGPEEYVIRRALKGKYRVEVDYYGNQQQVLAGATTIQAVLITDWGRATEKREAVTLRLKDEEEMVKVGVLEFGG